MKSFLSLKLLEKFRTHPTEILLHVIGHGLSERTKKSSEFFHSAKVVFSNNTNN